MDWEKGHSRLLLGTTLLVPGSGHILLGMRRRGLSILAFAAVLASLVLTRPGKLYDSFFRGSTDDLTAASFLLLLTAGVWVFAVRDIYRWMGGGEPNGRLSPMRLSIRRFAENDLALIALYVIIFLYIFAVIAPLIGGYDPIAMGDVLKSRYLAPSFAHPFGTDEFGRDIFSRAIFGARISLSVGLLAVLVAVSVGTLYGAVSGYFGGLVDSALMRFVDVLISIPTFFLMLLLVGILEVNLPLLVLILGLTSWLGTARLIRGEFLSLRKREYAEAARAIGLSDLQIISRHLVPNSLSPVLVSAALMVGGMITAEAGLSFLGIGIQPPTPSWGNILRDGSSSLWSAWWIAFFPGVLLAITVLCFNLIADGLRDAFDPKSLFQRNI